VDARIYLIHCTEAPSVEIKACTQLLTNTSNTCT